MYRHTGCNQGCAGWAGMFRGLKGCVGVLGLLGGDVRGSHRGVYVGVTMARISESIVIRSGGRTWGDAHDPTRVRKMQIMEPCRKMMARRVTRERVRESTNSKMGSRTRQQ